MKQQQPSHFCSPFILNFPGLTQHRFGSSPQDVTNSPGLTSRMLKILNLPFCFRIEKKRVVLPTLVEAVKGCDGKEIDWEYFYRLLFTTDNLKLVHIVCHKKTVHNLGCDRTKIYHKRKTGRKNRPLCSPRVQLSKMKQKNDAKLSKNKTPPLIAKKESA